MGFCVKDLLRLEILKEVRLVGGSAGLDNEITGVTIIEAPDIAKFVNGGEVLLTSFYAFKDCDAEEYESYMEQISAKKVSALVIKTGRVIQSAEDGRMALLVKLSQQYAVPLLQIPFETPFRSVMYPIMEHLFNDEVTKLKYFKTTHDNFVSLSLSLPAVPDGFEKVLYALEELIGNPVALFDRDLHCLATTNPGLDQFRMSPEVDDHTLTLYSKYTYLKQTVAVEKGDAWYTQYIVPISVMLGGKMFLVINETDRPIDELDYIAVENAITALLLEFSKLYTVSEVEKKFKSDIIGNILQGKIRSGQKLHQLAQKLHLRETAAYRVIVLGLSESAGGHLPSYGKQMEMNNLLNDSVTKLWPGAHVHDQASSIAVLQQIGHGCKPKRYMEELRETIGKIQAYVADVSPSFQLTAGLGNRVDGLANTPESCRQANDALQLAELVEREEGQSWKIVSYSELGVIRLLFEFHNLEKLREFIPESLLKLYEYKKTQKNDLIDTLKIYLDNNQNLSKTAQDLYVHYKTVIYRVERIAEITGIDFANANEVLAVRLGMIILKILNNASAGREPS